MTKQEILKAMQRRCNGLDFEGREIIKQEELTGREIIITGGYPEMIMDGETKHYYCLYIDDKTGFFTGQALTSLVDDYGINAMTNLKIQIGEKVTTKNRRSFTPVRVIDYVK